MKKGFYYIVALLTVLLLWSCSTKKNTKASRFYHAFTTRYNIYFNGKQAFDEAIKAALRQHGAVTALMTGSGAAVFGVFPTEEAARGAAEALKAQWPQVYVAQPDKGGARVVSPKWLL